MEEKAALGFYFSGHLFSYYKKIIKSFISTKLIDLRPRKESYLIAGIVSAVKYRQSSRGKIAIITIDDGEGRIDAILGNNLLTQSYNLIKDDDRQNGKVMIQTQQDQIRPLFQTIFPCPSHHK